MLLTRCGLRCALPLLVFVCTAQAQTRPARWVLVDSSLPPRAFARMVWDGARSQIVLFGGIAPPAEVISETWVWKGRSWERYSPPSSPAPRFTAPMAYDAMRQRVLLFGGTYDGTLQSFDDTWVWDGTNWSRQFFFRAPPARAGHGLAYDAARGEVVLFGGFSQNAVFNDTWIWNGSNWTLREPSGGRPPAYWDTSLVYDEARRQVVLFGGRCAIDNRVVLCDDTWLWDGRSWTKKDSATRPPGRTGHSMAYDAVQQKVVLFGGENAQGELLADTWLWDGSRWTRLETSAAPPPRFGHTMAFDVSRGEVLLVGGVLSGWASEQATWALQFSQGDARPQFRAEGVASAGSYATGAVSPGEIITIFGQGLGPEELVPLRVEDSGRVSTELAGTKVLFDGVAAPLVYVQARQLRAVVPFSVAGKDTTRIQVVRSGAASEEVILPVVSARPAVFTLDSSGRGEAAALHPDYKPVSRDNPTRPGSIIMLFATGAGQLNPAVPDGAVIRGERLPRPILPVSVRIGDRDAEVLYAGAAPELVAGVLQVNVRVPDGVPVGDAVPVTLRVGDAASQAGVTIAIASGVQPLSIADFRLEPSAVVGGQAARAVITFNRARAVGDPAVLLVASDNRLAASPVGSGTYSVPPGATSFEVPIGTTGVFNTVSANISASFANVTLRRVLTIDAGDAAFLLSRSSVTGGESLTATVRLSGPVAFELGEAIYLRSSHTAVRVPSSIVIPRGESSATFTIETSSVTGVVSATLTATAIPAIGGARSAQITVMPAGGSSGISLRNRDFQIDGTFRVGNATTGLQIQAVVDVISDPSGATHYLTISNGADVLRYPQFLAGFSSRGQVAGNTVTFEGRLLSSSNPTYYSPDGLRLYSVSAVTLSITFTTLTRGADVSGKIVFTTSGGTFEGTFTGKLTAI
jgi:uncharacterized protein (TIGR03437 family)